MKLKETATYPKTDASLKKGSGKDASAYKGDMGGGAKLKKGASKLDALGECKKKDQSCYKGQE